MNKFKLALIQLAVGTNKAANLERAASLIRKAAGNGAQVVSLPVRLLLDTSHCVYCVCLYGSGKFASARLDTV